MQKKKKLILPHDSTIDNTVVTLAVILAVLICVAAAIIGISKIDITGQASASAALRQGETAPGQKTPEIIDATDYGDPFVDIGQDAPITDASRRRGVYTVLVVGVDKASGSTDTMLLACLDTKAGKLNITTLSRDLFINSPYDIKKLNVIYPTAEKEGRDAVKALKEAVSCVTGYEVDNYAVINIDTAAQLVDAIGGLYFNVPQDMFYMDTAQDLYIDIKAGYQMLTGEQAVQVYRFRDGYVMGDVDRVSVQQELLMAIVKQTLSIGNIPNFGKIVNIVTNVVDTDLTAGNIVFYAAQYLMLKTDDVSFLKMPGNACYICGLAYYTMDIGKWIDMLNESFNPFDREIKANDLNVVTYDGWYIYSTTGRLSGGFESFYGFDDPGFWGETILQTYFDNTGGK